MFSKLAKLRREKKSQAKAYQKARETKDTDAMKAARLRIEKINEEIVRLSKE
jgi:hypothetical protein